MKKMVFVSAVAFLATAFVAATAAAQTPAVHKQTAATIACKGDSEACFNLEFSQKMAATSTAGAAAKGKQPSGATAAANNPVTERKTRAAGGVENNPTDDGGGSVQLTLNKNADRQRNGATTAQRSRGATAAANNPVTERRTRAAGGVENNPTDDGGGSVQLTLRKNADRQREAMPSARSARSGHTVRDRSRLAPRGGDPTENNPMVERTVGRTRTQATERPGNVVRPSASERRYYDAVHAREVTRHRPTDN